MLVNPYDTSSVAENLRTALTLSRREKQRLFEAGLEKVQVRCQPETNVEYRQTSAPGQARCQPETNI